MFKSTKHTVFSDLPGCEAAGGGTIPADLCVTNLKPDIVIIDNEKKILHIFELTVPLTSNIDQRHAEKAKNTHISSQMSQATNAQ